jgi:hypothetical protein
MMRKIKKVTTSQDDGLVGGSKNIPVGCVFEKRLAGRPKLEISKKVTASRDDKGKGTGFVESGCRTEALFISLGGPQVRDFSGRDDNSA